MSRLYYTPPREELFNEVKEKSIEIWNDVYETPECATRKINMIKDITNIEDNFMYMVSMFSSDNHIKLAGLISPEARSAIRERMIDGGSEKQYIVF